MYNNLGLLIGQTRMSRGERHGRGSVEGLITGTGTGTGVL